MSVIVVVFMCLLFAQVSHAATLTFTWTDNADNEQGFQMERQCDGTLGFSDVGTSVGPNVTTLQIQQSKDQVCDYRLRAFNPAGRSGPSNVVTFNSWTVPNPPGGLSLSASAAVSQAQHAVASLRQKAEHQGNPRATQWSNAADRTLGTALKLVVKAETELAL